MSHGLFPRFPHISPDCLKLGKSVLCGRVRGLLLAQSYTFEKPHRKLSLMSLIEYEIYPPISYGMLQFPYRTEW